MSSTVSNACYWILASCHEQSLVVQCQLWFAWMKIVSTCMSATELNTSELVNPGRRQKTTPRRAADCIFSLFSNKLSTLFWSFSDNLSTLFWSITYYIDRPSLPGHLFSARRPGLDWVYRLHVHSPYTGSIYQVHERWLTGSCHSKICLYSEYPTPDTGGEHMPKIVFLKNPSQPSLTWITVAFAKSPLAVLSQPDDSVTGTPTDKRVLRIFPNRQYIVTYFPQLTIQCYIFSPTDNTVLRICAVQRQARFPNWKHSVTDCAHAITLRHPACDSDLQQVSLFPTRC